ncbi:class I SAM-dependent methyltransferase [Bailinhaonella thermotolerans]|uniref:Methyltransferase domain-containing protein n=1 Tax=Bailinhaonella thermotolerans TaxID=1070861 RepID=A0A3A4AU85_9ACTN|nr:methyltransferase domain-containing protein [Bailinhaonella thermotolerans]RJL31855.1 methyltransferase domain-containing protein [Bailinhaonella thermotolerans]
MANTEQAEAWNGDNGKYWAENEDRYNRLMRRLTDRLMEAAAVSPGERVLDVGCGCGETTRLAARSSGHGEVLGVDLSAPMLAQARAQATRLGLANVRFEQADAQSHPFPGAAFDLALSRFGVMFFDDPVAAFANVAGALRSGGRLVFLCWQPLARQAQRVIPLRAIDPGTEIPEHHDPAEGGPYSLSDPAHTRDVLTKAGFTEVDIRPVEEPVLVGDDPDDAVSFLRHSPSIGSHIDEAADERAALTALRDALAAHHHPTEGVRLGAATWLVTAHRP